MASFALLKKASTASNLLNKITPSVRRVSAAPGRRRVSVAPSSLRSFTRSSAELNEESSDDELDELRSLGRHAYYGPNLYSGGVLDPFAPPVCVLDMMDNYGRNPFVVGDYPRGGGGERVYDLRSLKRGWDVVEDADVMYLMVDMPGLGKEHVKVSVEKTTLVMEGKGDKEVDKEGVRWYKRMIDLPENLFKIGEIKAEMKNGCLRVSVPKVKPDEKKDVVVVTVE